MATPRIVAAIFFCLIMTTSGAVAQEFQRHDRLIATTNHDGDLAPIIGADDFRTGEPPSSTNDEATVIWGSESEGCTGENLSSCSCDFGCCESHEMEPDCGIVAEPDCGISEAHGCCSCGEPDCGISESTTENGCTCGEEPDCGISESTEPTCGISSCSCQGCSGGGHGTISAPTKCGVKKCGCRRKHAGGDGCGLCWELGDPISVWDEFLGDCAEDSPWILGGWVAAGYYNRSNGLFNSHPDRFNVTQGWLYLEREPDTENKQVDWGLRADVMYGVDAADTQAFGNNPGRFDFQNGWDRGADYGWALPQIYGTIATEDISVQIGHFYTLVGYEVVQATGNFFFSHAYTMYNSEPFTHTGAVATINASDDITIYGGWTAGWDTGFDQFDDGNSFLGGIGLSLSEDVSLTYITTFGDLGFRGDDGYSHSIVLDANLNEKLNYVFQSDLLRATDVGSTTVTEDVGVNQYLFYELCDTIVLGTRIEWWKNDGTSFCEWTTGINFRPIANWVLRPELRHDWSPANDLSQTIFAIDVVTTF